MKKSITSALGLGAVALLLTGCAGTAVNASDDGAPADGGTIAAAPGFDPATKTIRLGSLNPVSGVWAGAISNVQGLEAAFLEATQPGGPLEGYTIELENQDTNYDPSVAVPLFNGMKDDVVMFPLVLGSHIVSAILPTLESEDIIALPSGTVTPFLFEPNIIPTFPLNNTYFSGALDYFYDELGEKDATYCSLVVEDAFGEATTETLDFAIEELGVEFAARPRFAPGTTDFSAQITELKSKGCETVLVNGTGSVLQDFAAKAATLDFAPKVVSTSHAYNITLATGPAADWIKEHVVIVGSGDEWNGTQAQSQANMLSALDALTEETGAKIAPSANSFNLSYTNGRVAVAILAKALESGDMSRANILKIAQSELGTFDDLGASGGAFEYGSSVEERMPPHGFSVFVVDPAVETGLKLQEFGYDSPTTKAFLESLSS